MSIPLILASSSAYRKSLLERLHLPFKVAAPNVDESRTPDESGLSAVSRLARTKAYAVADQHPDAIVIASDQLAIMGATIVGKPGTHEVALQQLKSMQGREIFFHTALFVLDRLKDGKRQEHRSVLSTTVAFRDLSDDELERYLRIEKPYDCAGSAKNEGLGIALIERISSDDPSALTGLPLIKLCSFLRVCGVEFFR